MEVNIQAKINEHMVLSSIAEVERLIDIPSNVKLFVFDQLNQCPIAFKSLRNEVIRKQYLKFCKAERTSMSLTYGDNNIIIIQIGPQDNYLKKNKIALIGTILHEVMHTRQRKKYHLDYKLYPETNKAFKQFQKDRGKKFPQGLLKMYSRITDEAMFTLKDIYANSALIDKKLGKYILADYSNLYKSKPKPAFYSDLKHAVTKERNFVEDAMVFEINLMSAVVPFLRMKHKDAKNFVEHISEGYETHIWEIADTFNHPIWYAVDNLNWRPSFRVKFFKLIYEAIDEVLNWDPK